MSAYATKKYRSFVGAEMLGGRPADPAALAGPVQAALARSGRSVQKDGQPVSDPTESMRIVTEALRNIVERRLPILRRMGVVE